MRRRTLPALLAVLVPVPLAVLGVVLVRHGPAPAAAPGVASIISRGVPAYASSSGAERANDDDYGTEWRSSGTPAWLAYDLSGVPAAKRQRVLAVYYNNSYGYSTRSGPHYNNLGSYRIESSTAAGGGAPPDSGWRSLVEVERNTLHSRQHVLRLAGANWLRIRITASDGAAMNTDASTNSFDVYDVGTGRAQVPDDFIFYGDSITAGGMCPCPGGGVPSLPELIHAAHPPAWPVMENGGEPGETSAGALHALVGPAGYLSQFPGTYVGLSFGMNDAGVDGGQQTYYENMKQLVQAVLATGKIPMVPTIGYTGDRERNARIPAYNAQVQRLYGEFRQIVPGPDFWAAFRAHPELVGANDIHPSAAGYAAMRQLWAQALLSTVYSAGSGAVAMTGLHVVGNRIVNADGRTARLVGVNHSGTEYACVGGGKQGASGYAIFEPPDFGSNAAYLTAIRGWGANTIRIGLNQACWLGTSGVTAAHSGPAYRQALSRFVAQATGAGLAVVLELHWSAPGTGPDFVPHGQAPMPDREHSVALWRQVAETFRGNPAVVFDLFNEPYPNANRDDEPAWQCWRDGSDRADAGNSRRCAGTEWWDRDGNRLHGGRGYPYPVAGMQELLDAVRGTGAKNLVLLAGPRYGNSLARWPDYRPSDPTGNLAASWHVYPDNPCASQDCWDASVSPVATQVPVVATEFGQADCRSTFVDPLMSWLDRRGGSYLAWTWNTWGCAGHALVTDAARGTPTPYGRAVRDHFRAVTGGAPALPSPTGPPRRAAAVAPGTRLSLWPARTVPASPPVDDPAAVELGLRFTSDVPGQVLGVRFYQGPGNTGPHRVSVWDGQGRSVGTATSAAGTTTGWQDVRFRRPVRVVPGGTYVASYHAGAGHYCVDPEYFRGRQVDNGPLHALGGVFRYGGSSFPTDTWRAASYYVDLLFVTGG
ncbi:MAG: DUF4082 domain-containing protein [Mycobacteriales bacterium]